MQVPHTASHSPAAELNGLISCKMQGALSQAGNYAGTRRSSRSTSRAPTAATPGHALGHSPVCLPKISAYTELEPSLSPQTPLGEIRSEQLPARRYTPEQQKQFEGTPGGYAWTGAQDPTLLDHKRCELLMIGATDDPQRIEGKPEVMTVSACHPLNSVCKPVVRCLQQAACESGDDAADPTQASGHECGSPKGPVEDG